MSDNAAHNYPDPSSCIKYEDSCCNIKSEVKQESNGDAIFAEVKQEFNDDAIFAEVVKCEDENKACAISDEIKHEDVLTNIKIEPIIYEAVSSFQLTNYNNSSGAVQCGICGCDSCEHII